MISNQKVVIVTGSSSGIGREISLVLAKNGFITYATMRNLQKGSDLKSIAEIERLPLHFLQLDVTDERTINTSIQTIYNEAGRIDILVNNAGYALSGTFEDISIDEIKAQYETNVFGLIRTTQAVLPIMRKQKSGMIINISSGLGRFGMPVLSGYVSSKFAVEGLSESMSHKLEPFGIKTVIVEPGVINTNFHNSMIMAEKSKDPNSPYFSLIKGRANNLNKLIANGSTSQLVAKIVLDAVTSANPKLRYLAGKDIERWIESKKSMTDEDFIDMIKQR
ncbi:MAG TPA: SDR family oxidoreductase [Candidatus Sulfopaludibacter sp.]|nr:SDR family oxidoreductase [Candidatus Sulfopaludibacter sp.]